MGPLMRKYCPVWIKVLTSLLSIAVPFCFNYNSTCYHLFLLKGHQLKIKTGFQVLYKDNSGHGSQWPFLGHKGSHEQTNVGDNRFGKCQPMRRKILGCAKVWVRHLDRFLFRLSDVKLGLSLLYAGWSIGGAVLRSSGTPLNTWSQNSSEQLETLAPGLSLSPYLWEKCQMQSRRVSDEKLKERQKEGQVGGTPSLPARGNKIYFPQRFAERRQTQTPNPP